MRGTGQCLSITCYGIWNFWSHPNVPLSIYIDQNFPRKRKTYCKNLTDGVSLYLSLSYCYIVRKLQEVSIKQINQETQKGCWLITGLQMFFVSSIHFLFLFVGYWQKLSSLFSINTHSIEAFPIDLLQRITWQLSILRIVFYEQTTNN